MEALAASAIALVAPYLAKGAEEFAKSGGKDAYEAVKAVVTRLQAWWAKSKLAGTAVEEMATNPTESSEILSQLLAKELSRDQAFADELGALLKSAGPYVEVVQKMEVANGVVGADIEEILKGSLRVVQEMKQAANVTGVKSKRLG